MSWTKKLHRTFHQHGAKLTLLKVLANIARIIIQRRCQHVNNFRFLDIRLFTRDHGIADVVSSLLKKTKKNESLIRQRCSSVETLKGCFENRWKHSHMYFSWLKGGKKDDDRNNQIRHSIHQHSGLVFMICCQPVHGNTETSNFTLSVCDSLNLIKHYLSSGVIAHLEMY